MPVAEAQAVRVARVVVLGAGAIGCYLGARLFAAGHQVVLVGRPSQVAAIQSRGLRLTGLDGEPGPRTYQLPARTELRPPGEDEPDLVLLAVKTQDVPQACRLLAAATTRAPVVLLQNGIHADALAAALLPPQRLVGGVVTCAASYLEPGEVAVQFPGWVTLGAPPGGSERVVAQAAAVLQDALPVLPTRHLASARWAKLLANLNNALPAATGEPLLELMSVRAGRLLVVRLLREGRAVARACGVRLPGLWPPPAPAWHRPEAGPAARALVASRRTALVAAAQALLVPALAQTPEPLAERLIQVAQRTSLNQLALTIRGSTWQSLQRGRPTEIDYLNGAIVQLGAEHGLATPYNRLAVERVHQVERTGQYVSLLALFPPAPAPASPPPPPRRGSTPAGSSRSRPAA